MNITSIIKEKTFIPSENILNKDFQGIDFEGFSIFEKKDNLLESTICGIELKYIGVIAFILWYLKNN